MAIDFEVGANIRAKIDEFADALSEKEIRAALAGAMNAAATQSKRLLADEAFKKYNLKKSEFNKGYRVERADARKDVIRARIFVESKPLPLLAFVKGSQRKGVAIQIENRTIMKDAFETTVGGSHEGLFHTVGAPVAPSKGRYAGKTITRGPNKGKLVLRKKIEEYYAMTSAQYVYYSSDKAMPEIDKLTYTEFSKRLDARLAKNQAK